VLADLFVLPSELSDAFSFFPPRDRWIKVDESIKTCYLVSMFKRNQVEQAISDLLDEGAVRPSTGLRTRIKRLLETDRLLGCMPRSNDPEKRNYAFFREGAPGSGFEVWFSAYEAFALLLGLQFLWHNWPQRFAVSVLRRVRSDLETEHERILKLDPKILFDRKTIDLKLEAGTPVFDTLQPAFLSIVSRYGMPLEQQQAPYACAVHDDLAGASDWISKTIKGVGGGSSMFELTVLAHQLARELERTKPQRRGRPG
jgi:hypothetical protein